MFVVFLIAACLQRLSDMSQLVSGMQVLLTLQLPGRGEQWEGCAGGRGGLTGRCNSQHLLLCLQAAGKVVMKDIEQNATQRSAKGQICPDSLSIWAYAPYPEASADSPRQPHRAYCNSADIEKCITPAY